MLRTKRHAGQLCPCGTALGMVLAAISTTLLPLAEAQTLAQPAPCIRWAGSSTLGVPPNGGNGSSTSTLYYGFGDAKTTAGQTQNTRTNALVSLDLTSNWSIANPPFQLVQADTGNDYNPPRTSLGAMFSSGDGEDLFYYGGYFSDNPTVEPDAQRLFRYNIPSKNWSPVTTSGDTVTRVAEGASGVTPPTNEGGDPNWYYMGGHLDAYTTEGWSIQTERVYLNSMIEYDQSSSSWINRTSYSQSGSSSANSTAESAPILRADNTLTFVPGLGTRSQGLLVSIGGGNANQMMDNSILDVYDIGAQGWTKQATQGQTIGPRVGHCAVRGSAKVNGVLQHQIYVYGGQASNRTTQILNGQNSDLYVLSIPSFTWTFVGSSLPSQPTGRAAHTCTLLGSQMVVIGGFVSEDLICEQPGVYVLDTSTLTWSTQYVANTTYTTPDHPEILAVTGGRGTGSSTAGSGYAIGTGANDTDTSSQFADDNNGGGGGSNTGAIAGGVVGGLVAAAIIAGLIFFFWRKKKRAAKAEQEKEKKALASSNGDSPGSVPSNPYEEYAAADDVEDRTAGYNAQFSHLVPRQTLRVVNA